MNAHRIRSKDGGFTPRAGTYLRSWPMYSDGATHPDPVIHHCQTKDAYKKYTLMVDTVGFLQNDFNPCYHERYVSTDKIPGRVAVVDDMGGTHERRTSFDRQLLDPIVDCRSLPIPMGSWPDDFSARAMNHFQVLVKTEYSLINFIIEMIQLCEGNIEILTNFKKKYDETMRRFFEKFRYTGNFWVAWNFAIKPTLADFKAMLSMLRKAQKRLKWLSERNHKNTKVHYREGPREYDFKAPFGLAAINVTQPYFEPVPQYVGPPKNQIWGEWPDWVEPDITVEANTYAEVSFSSWAWIRFDIPDAYLEGLPGLGIVLSAMQGLYNPLAIGWEAVPFSWLIDWFRTTRHKLEETLKSDLNPLGVATVIGTGWSVKIRAIGQFESTQFDLLGGPVVPIVTKEGLGNFVYRLYLRQPGLPSDGSSPFTLNLGWYNASILTTLIAGLERRG